MTKMGSVLPSNLLDEALADLISQIRLFVLSPQRNIHIGVTIGSTFFLSGYFRKSRRSIGGELLDAFDVATISVAEEFRHHGAFSEVLRRLEEERFASVLYLESVLHPWLERALERRGYTRRQGDDSSWWKVVSAS